MSTTTMITPENCHFEFPNIIEKIDALRESEIRISVTHTNRASEIGDPCLRKLVYYRLHPEKQEPPSLKTQYIFREGIMQEKALIADINSTDLTFVHQQKDFFDEKFMLSGHIDGSIKVGNRFLPTEIKSSHPYVWEIVKAYEDFKKKPWLRKYPGQMQTYMFLSNNEYGILILKNKSNGLIKQINFCLDYEFCESLLKKCEIVNAYVDRKEIPDPYFSDGCDMCCFKTFCSPDQLAESPLAFVDMPEVEELLVARETHKVASSSYNSADRKIKEKLKPALEKMNTEKLVIGDFLIIFKDNRFKITALQPQPEANEEVFT